MKIAIWWIRRDLRLTDNGALHKAYQESDQVIPLYILDPHLLNSNYVGQKRIDFLIAGLHALDHETGLLSLRQQTRSNTARQPSNTALHCKQSCYPFARAGTKKRWQSLYDLYTVS